MYREGKRRPGDLPPGQFVVEDWGVSTVLRALRHRAPGDRAYDQPLGNGPGHGPCPQIDRTGSGWVRIDRSGLATGFQDRKYNQHRIITGHIGNPSRA